MTESTPSLKVAIVGSGSVQFMEELADFASLADIGEYELACHDTDSHRLDISVGVAQRVAAATNTPCRVTAHRERKGAVDGALATVVSVGVGMQESIKPDFEIPARYGLRQTVADTLGVGAVIRILRTAPALAEIARDVVDYGASPLVLNVTNPMAMVCMALDRMVPDAQTIGLCHSAWQTASELADRLDVPIAELDYAAAGVNHQAWFQRLSHNGIDLYPRLREMARTDVEWSRTVRADLLRRLGYFPTESSKHGAEYVAWYLHRDDEIARFGLPVNPYDQRKSDNVEWLGEAEAVAAGLVNIPVEELPSGEYAPRIVRSLVTGVADQIHVNVPNRQGLVAELPEWGVVEVPATCDGDGIHPIAAEPLAPQCAALNRRYLEVCDLAVRAVVEGDREHVHHAVMLDPNSSATLSLDQMASMVDELLDAHQDAGRLPVGLCR